MIYPFMPLYHLIRCVSFLWRYAFTHKKGCLEIFLRGLVYALHILANGVAMWPVSQGVRME
jgi:hypothetical protein